MSSPDSIDTPAQLINFPPEVHAAYRHYLTHHDRESAQSIVVAALHDFLPKNSPVRKDEAFRDDQRLVEDLGFDSLALAEIIFFVEDLFQVTIANDEIKSVATVGALRNFVGQKIESRPKKE